MTAHISRRVLPVILMLAFAATTMGESHLMRFADVHKDKIVFTYEDDLWLVSAEGGDARRITSDPGSETWAKFSPDGSKIAFTAEYDGGLDVYVMDASGGVPQRLTWYPSPDRVVGWCPDGKSVLFRSRRQYPIRGEEVFKVSLDGGMPEQLPVDRAGLSSLSPDGKYIAYNRISRESSSWKRHKGGTAQEIWMGSLEEGDFKKITDWEGTDNFPMWHNNSIYFTSDRNHGTLNIFKYDVGSGEVTALTDYSDYDVKYPSIGPKQIVYQYGESLYLLDLASGKTGMVHVSIPSDRVRMRPEFVSVSPSTGSFGLSPAGKRMLLEARGEILNVPVEDGEPINLTQTPGSREKNAAWSPNGKWVAFISDKTGEEELYLVDQKGKDAWRQLTTGGLGFRMQPVWSPDSKYLIFSDKFLKLNMVDVATGKISVIDVADYDDAWERWGIQDYCWSPDSKWIAYTKMEESGYEAIFLFSMDKLAVYRVTDEMNQDWSPSFDPDGRYLYFLSNRTFDPIMGQVDQNHIYVDMARPYIVILQDDAQSPFMPKDSEAEITEDDKADDDASSDANEDSDDDGEDDDGEEDESIEIDIEGIGNRIIAAEGVSSGNYFRLEATEKGLCYLAKTELEFIKYQSVTDHTGGSLDLYHYDLEEKEATKVLGGIANYHQSSDGKKLVYRHGSSYGVVDVGKKASTGDGQVDLSNVRIKVDRNQEYLQIFNEAWRVERDWFYDSDLHGVDWDAIGQKYRKFVPFCGNRADLTYLIREMIAELNIGHTYAWGGDEANDARHVPVGLLGAEFKAKGGERYYQVSHIIPGVSWRESDRSPLAEPGCPIEEGDYLIAIDGHEITTDDNVFRYLQHKAGEVVTLTYNDKPSAEDAETYRTKTVRRESGLKYREWVENNRAAVEKASGGQIGYVHIPDMGRQGLIEFARAFYPHHYKKGIILDDRYNGGGFTADMIIDRLERKMWGVTQPREGKDLRDPERVFHGHFAVLINEDTGSCGEFFAQAIKLKKLAKVIGMRTWGGAIGIEPHQPMVDGGTVTPPQFGLYGLDRTWLIEGHGVDPDIEVQNMPGDVVRGKDAQLDKAVEYLLDQIKNDPKDIPSAPEYPDKSKNK